MFLTSACCPALDQKMFDVTANIVHAEARIYPLQKKSNRGRQPGKTHVLADHPCSRGFSVTCLILIF